MRWRERASERVTQATSQTTEWINREQQDHPELAELAIQLYERDRDAFASVLGSALALRLFLFVVTANVALVGLIALEVKVRMKSVLLVTGLFAFLTLSAAMYSWMRDVGGIAVGIGVWAAVLATSAIGTFVFMYAMPRRGTDPGVLLPGVALVAAGFTLLQWFMQLYLPGRIERTQDTLGDMAIAVAALGYFFYFGRLIATAYVLNATLHDRYGSVTTFVFGLPLLRRIPTRWPRMAAFFELTAAPATEAQPPEEAT